MQIDIRKFFNHQVEPVHITKTLDLSQEDFQDFVIKEDIKFDVTAQKNEDAVELVLQINGNIAYDCARCLEPSSKEIAIKQNYFIRNLDWEEDTAELPFVNNGKLDIHELIYTEIVLEVPGVLLCREDCAGLCPICGNRKPCACTHETNEETDERLSILKQLLT